MLIDDTMGLVSWICGSARLRVGLIGGSVTRMNEIETDRLRLRGFTEDDADFVLKLVNDEGWLRYIGDRGIRNADQAREYIGRMVSMWEDNDYGAYLVALRDSGAPIGLAGLFKREGLDYPDVGFALLGEYRGHGYALEASEAVMRNSWGRCRLKRIGAITVQENGASIRLLEKLGMTFEKTVRLPGSDEDVELYAVDRAG